MDGLDEDDHYDDGEDRQTFNLLLLLLLLLLQIHIVSKVSMSIHCLEISTLHKRERERETKMKRNRPHATYTWHYMIGSLRSLETTKNVTGLWVCLYFLAPDIDRCPVLTKTRARP